MTALLPSYLAAWLIWMMLPLGALPLVLGREALGLPDGPATGVLRRLLPLLPVGALLAIPILLYTGVLFRRPGVEHALPAAWMAPGPFVLRAVVILLVLSALAVVFARPPRRRPRSTLAVLGLVLHAPLMSVAAVDWIMSLQPGLGSSAFGLLVITGQLGAAASLAGFAAAIATPAGARLPGSFATLMLVALAFWLLLQFGQYLVVWSANLPPEIAWYQARMQGAGLPVIGFAAAASALALMLLPLAARRPVILASIAAMVLLMHAAEMLWLVLPSFRGRLSVGWADAGALAVMGALLVLVLMALLPRQELRHAAR